jgi:hypothetical protein
MTLQEVAPYMVCVNLAEREDRRRAAWKTFAEAGLEVDRQPGVPKRSVKDCRGFYRPQRYACSLAKRMAIRGGRRTGAPAVVLFEDDIVLAPDLHERLAEIELPEDWGIFFLGCRHRERPVPHAPGLVRVTRAVDHHAMVIRAERIGEVLRGLSGHGKGAPATIRFCDDKMSWIQGHSFWIFGVLSYRHQAGRRKVPGLSDGKRPRGISIGWPALAAGGGYFIFGGSGFQRLYRRRGRPPISSVRKGRSSYRKRATTP